MGPITEFEFSVDEQYENEKGVFTVISIDNDEMLIRWEHGEEIRTEIDLQRRIQARRQRERAESEAQAEAAQNRTGKRTGSKTPQVFEGFQPGDFKNSAAQTNWRGRNQLGRAVIRNLPKTRFDFSSWAYAQKPEMHVSDKEHHTRNGSGDQARFFVRLDPLSLVYGFCASRPDGSSGASKDWDALAAWLMQHENDHMLQELAATHNLAVCDRMRSVSGTLLPFEDGWKIDGGEKSQKMDMLAGFIDLLPATGGVSMEIARMVEKSDVVARGKDIADDIAELFARLMPLYEAAVK